MVGDGLPLGWLAPIDWDGEAEDAALVDLRINFHEAVVELNQLHRDLCSYTRSARYWGLKGKAHKEAKSLIAPVVSWSSNAAIKRTGHTAPPN